MKNLLCTLALTGICLLTGGVALGQASATSPSHEGLDNGAVARASNRILILSATYVDSGADSAGFNKLTEDITQAFSAQLQPKLLTANKTPININDKESKYSAGQKLALHAAKNEADAAVLLSIDSQKSNGQFSIFLKVRYVDLRYMMKDGAPTSVMPTNAFERSYYLRGPQGDTNQSFEQLADAFMADLAARPPSPTQTVAAPVAAPNTDKKAGVNKGGGLPRDRSGIYVYRNEIFGAFVKMEVKIDSSVLGQTSAKTYVYQEVAPGKHVITSTAENTDTIEIETQPGTVSYVWQEVKLGFGSAKSKLSLVDAETGKKGVEESKPLVAAMAQAKSTLSTAASPAPSPETKVSRPQVAKPAVLGSFKPDNAVPITLDMVRNRTWRYPHPRDFEKNGTIELVFSEGGVQATSNIGGSMGTYELRDGALCLALVQWTSYCVYVMEEEGQKMVFFSTRGNKVKLTIE